MQYFGHKKELVNMKLQVMKRAFPILILNNSMF